jgi:DNA-binding NarL/FixJ family response regulator
VRTLVRAAGGSVDVESAPGAGTTVVLELPTRRSSRRSRRPALSAHPAGDDESCAALSTHGARRTRILCADDHTVVTEGLRARLDREPDLEVVKVLPSAEHLGVEASLSNADVVILDIEMPGPDPFEVARDLRTSCPHVRTVFLSAYVKDHFIDRAIEAGASGYLDKGCDPDAIVAAVRRIAAGERVFSARVAARHSTPNELRASARSKLDRLTPREVQILAMIGHGLSRQDIAIATHRSVKTIDTHRAAIMRKLDLHDRTDLALFAVREGLVAT